MTITEAVKILAGPLVFGNPEHIKAVNYRAQVDACIAAVAACAHDDGCPTCEGDGIVTCECEQCGDEHDRKCTACDGTAVRSGFDCEICMKPYIEEIRHAAHYIQRVGWEKQTA